MKSDFESSLLSFFDNTQNTLNSLESIIIVLKSLCLDNEINANYYNTSGIMQVELSRERNHYINLLTIAIEKIYEIKNSNDTEEMKILSLQNNSDNSGR